MTTTTRSQKPDRSFHLLIEAVDAAQPDAALVGSMEVPEEGVAVLELSGDTPRLVPCDAAMPEDFELAFSVARYDGRAHLVALPGHRCRALLNGDKPPPFDVLELGDEILLESLRLHVSLHLRPYVGPPRHEDVGRECPVCRVPIEREGDDAVVIHVCPHCDGIVHLRATLEGESEPLECIALSSSCPTCGNPILAEDEEHFAYVPAC